MRVTNQMMYFNTRYDYGKTMNRLYEVDKDISSGLKIQQNYENAIIYDDTMRLDYDLITLGQVKDTATKARTFSDNSDKALNQMSNLLIDIRTKLVKAANSGTASVTSLQAIANDIRGFKDSLVSIANTSINGQFLFSGSATDKMPIDSNGNYMGNNKHMKALIGSKVELPFNLPGESLFMGRDGDYNKIIKTNVKLTNQLKPDKVEYITEESTIEELMGEHEGNSVFYIQGRKPNGDTFRKTIEIEPKDTMKDLLYTIRNEFKGNPNDDEQVVNVSMNKSGQIVIEDTRKGNSMIDFNIIAAIDKNATKGQSGNAKTDDISDLKNTADVKILNMIKGDRLNLDGIQTDGSDYSKIKFLKSGNSVTGSVSQVIKGNSEYAIDSTKLSEVAGGTLDGEKFVLEGKNIYGKEFKITLDFKDKSTFQIDGGETYEIFERIQDPLNNNIQEATKANEITYRQLNDIIAMATSDIEPKDVLLPVGVDDTPQNRYNHAINQSRKDVNVKLDYRGRINVQDRFHPSSKIELSLYNENAGNFANTKGDILTFSSNNAITVDEPHVDIFKDLEEMIIAVEKGLTESDADSEYSRNIGVESAIKRIDHINDHISKNHTKIGVVSNTLESAETRAELLSLNVSEVQSKIIDTDIGEAFLRLNQLMLNYQAILQSTSKINSLSLVNFM